MMDLWSFVIRHPFLMGLTLVVLGMLLYEEVLVLLLRDWLITVGEAVGLINHHSALVLDLREDKEFKKGHILGAEQVVASQLSGRLDDGKPLILVLANDTDFLTIRNQLPKGIVERVKILRGGVTAWQEAGLPLVN